MDRVGALISAPRVRAGDAFERLVDGREGLLDGGPRCMVGARFGHLDLHQPALAHEAAVVAAHPRSSGGPRSRGSRPTIGLDPRIATNHTLRKMFKSIAIKAGVSTRVSERLTGHAQVAAADPPPGSR